MKAKQNYLSSLCQLTTALLRLHRGFELLSPTGVNQFLTANGSAKVVFLTTKGRLLPVVEEPSI